MVIEDTKIITDNIDDFIDVPDGINRLRKAILTLAVSGKLVPQDSKEGTGEELYQKILEERNSQAKKNGKKLDALSPVIESKIPIKIPESWRWTRIGEIANLITDGEHISPTKHSKGVPLLTAKNVLENGITFDVKDFVSEKDANRFWMRCNPERNDLLICSRGTIGRTTTVNTDIKFVLMGSVILIKLFNSETSNYIKYYLRTYSGLSQIGLLQKGIAVNALYLKDMKTAIIPLPPLFEQKRIVEKVDELMKIVDDLEKKKKESDAVRSKLTISAFHSLGKNESQIALKNISELVESLDDVKELEKAILSLAVSGKLVQQDSKEGTGEELYQKIQIERAREFKENGTKMSIVTSISDSKIPFKIPESWRWTRIGEIANLITDGEHISPTKLSRGVPLLTAKNVLENGITFDVKDFVSEKDANRFWKRCNPKRNDLLICSRGTIGRTTTVNTDKNFVLMGSVILIKLYNKDTSNYIKYYLRTYPGMSQIGLLQKGIAVNALYLKDIKMAIIPLPPLPEQKRIVEKVDELMNLTKKLKSIMIK